MFIGRGILGTITVSAGGFLLSGRCLMEQRSEPGHEVEWERGDLIEMLFFDRRKGEERRSGKDRRQLENPDYWRPEKRSGAERRKGKDRRTGVDRRSGRYHRLPEDRRNTVDAILASLEKLLD